jgi:hypothetical protein
VADVFDLRAAVWAIAGLSVASGMVVAIRMAPSSRTPLASATTP